MKKKPTTIKDIAKALNVSTSTVSRALNDHYAISQATKDKISAKAAEMNYARNIVALSLKSQTTKTIGVILPELIHFFFSSVIAGIEEVAYEHGYTVMVCQSNESYDKEVKDTMALLSHRVDGMLVSVAKETHNVAHFEEVKAREVPLVFFDRAPEDFLAPKVSIDDVDAGRKASQHLINNGCLRILHLASELNMSISSDRRDGYKEALKRNGIPFDENLVIDCPTGDQAEAFVKTKAFLSTNKDVDGVFAGNDLMAVGAIKAIESFGLSVPNDIAVIGFSNWNFCTMIEPQLSSISQPGKQMGRTAMETLIRLLKGKVEVPEELLLKTEVIERSSSKAIVIA